MPRSSGAKALANKLATSPEAKARIAIKRLMLERDDVVCEKEEFEAKHHAVLDQLETYQSRILHLDNQIKDAARALYRDGSTRGIYTLFDDDHAYVKVTVKYSRDTFEPKMIGKWLAEHCDADKLEDLWPKLIREEQYVDVDALRDLVEEGALPEDVLDLGMRGDFQTPAVTIKDKIQTSVTVRDE